MALQTKELFRELALRFDGTQPLTREQEPWYAPRPRPVAEEILAELDRANRRRVVLFGQPGIGKSTELNLVGREARERGFRVAQIGIEQIADLNLLGWDDLAVLCVLWLAYGLRREVDKKGWSPFQSQSLDELVTSLGFTELPEAGSAFRHSHPQIRSAIARSPQQILDLCQQVINHISSRLNRRIVAVVDGTDRLSPERAAAMLFERGPLIYEFPCSLAIALPLDIQFEPWYPQVEDHFHDVVRMRPQIPDAPPAQQFFTDLCRRRLGDTPWESVFPSPELFVQFVRYGAGVPRQFLTLVSYALRVAELESRPSLDRYCLDRAVEKVRERFFYVLSERLLYDLGEVTAGRIKIEQGDLNALLRLGALIEYEVPGQPLPQRAANPVCEALLVDFTAGAWQS